MEELRADDSRQSDRYDELWKAYEALLEVTQKLPSWLIFLSSESPVEGPGGTNRDPEGYSFRPNGSGNQFGRPTDQAGSSGSWRDRPRGWSED